MKKTQNRAKQIKKIQHGGSETNDFVFERSSTFGTFANGGNIQ